MQDARFIVWDHKNKEAVFIESRAIWMDLVKEYRDHFILDLFDEDPFLRYGYLQGTNYANATWHRAKHTTDNLPREVPAEFKVHLMLLGVTP